MKSSDWILCCICKQQIDKQRTEDGEVYWDEGHNAEPVDEGRCCTNCNDTVVIPARLMQFGKPLKAKWKVIEKTKEN